MGGKIVEIRTKHKYDRDSYFLSLCKYVERCCIFRSGAAFEVFGSDYNDEVKSTDLIRFSTVNLAKCMRHSNITEIVKLPSNNGDSERYGARIVYNDQRMQKFFLSDDIYLVPRCLCIPVNGESYSYKVDRVTALDLVMGDELYCEFLKVNRECGDIF